MNERAAPQVTATATAPDMAAFWMPFAANRQFKSAAAAVEREGVRRAVLQGRVVGNEKRRTGWLPVRRFYRPCCAQKAT